MVEQKQIDFSIVLLEHLIAMHKAGLVYSKEQYENMKIISKNIHSPGLAAHLDLAFLSSFVSSERLNSSTRDTMAVIREHRLYLEYLKRHPDPNKTPAQLCKDAREVFKCKPYRNAMMNFVQKKMELDSITLDIMDNQGDVLP